MIKCLLLFAKLRFIYKFFPDNCHYIDVTVPKQRLKPIIVAFISSQFNLTVPLPQGSSGS